MLTPSEKLLIKFALHRLIGTALLTKNGAVKIHCADFCIVFTAKQIQELADKLDRC